MAVECACLVLYRQISHAPCYSASEGCMPVGTSFTFIDASWLVCVCVRLPQPKAPEDWEKRFLGKGWSFRGQLFKSFM